MSRYRVRSCPNCHYYLGFTAPTRAAKSIETTVTNFCLNCNYKMPVTALIRGVSRPARTARRGLLKLVVGAAQNTAPDNNAASTSETTESLIDAADYSRHLRVIGQDLEKLKLTTFNLECSNGSYLVWLRLDTTPARQHPLVRITRNRIQRLWHSRSQGSALAREETYTDSSAQTGKRLRYAIEDLDRIEIERQQLRRFPNGTLDGHGLSQLLRTVGEVVHQSGEKLLAISWQEFSIIMVVENARGRKQMDAYRPDNLYDLWVRMYLKRSSRAASDTSR